MSVAGGKGQRFSRPPFCVRRLFAAKKKTGRKANLPACIVSGANERIRTADLRITSALLYQLSHVGMCVSPNAKMKYSGCAARMQGVLSSLSRFFEVPVARRIPIAYDGCAR